MMKKISGSTFYFKKLFPTVWFGFLAFIFMSLITSGLAGKSFMVFAGPTFMAVFGFFLFKKIAWALADEVYDHGDSLEFRRGKKTQRVNLKEIINIEYSHMSSPERVVVHTRNKGEMGNELVFCTPMRFNFFKKSPVVRELIERVDKARNT